jgi:hypothetical protein
MGDYCGRVVDRLPVVLLGALSAVFVLASLSFAAAPQTAASVVIFVDFSASVAGDERAGYKRELERHVIPWLQAGDSILIAPIHDKTLTAFEPLVQVTIPTKPEFSGWFDNVLTYGRQQKEFEARIAKAKELIRTQTDEALSQSRSAPLTDIFSSLLLAEKLFHDDPRARIVVLMSDMLHDYPPYRFDRMAWRAGTTDAILADLQAKDMIPKLGGVCVYVSGATASSKELAHQVGRFWQAYFQRAGADMAPSRYAHVLLHWPPSRTACRSR